MADEPIAELTDWEKSALAETGTYLALGWPPFLAKAAMDPFFYAVGLRTGAVVFFEEAEKLDGCPDWVALRGVREHSVRTLRDHPIDRFTFERGLHVRLADIMWVADAPYGS
jgi:hypothetical protein